MAVDDPRLRDRAGRFRARPTDEERARPWLVGESNPRGGGQRRAFWPSPPGTAGARLCRLLGLAPDEYVARFNRRNLLPGRTRWSAMDARDAARALLAEAGPGARIVLFGARVAAAFGALSQAKGLSAAVEGIARNPSAAGEIRGNLILGLVLIESLVIYVLLISLILFFVSPFGK